jgi:hypothetical protein
MLIGSPNESSCDYSKRPSEEISGDPHSAMAIDAMEVTPDERGPEPNFSQIEVLFFLPMEVVFEID